MRFPPRARLRFHRSPLAALTLSAMVLLSGTVLQPPAAAADGPVGFVYVNNNTAANTVEGFARASDNSLTPLAGSPFAIGGAGLGTAGLGSQGGIELSTDGRFLLAVDAGSNQISVLRVRDNGALEPVLGSPFPSNGTRPVSVAVQDNTVFVANQGDANTVASQCNIFTGGGSNYTGFRMNPNGALTPLANSTYCVPPGAGLGDVLISPDKRHVVGVRVGTVLSNSFVDSFDLDVDGALTVSPGTPFPAQVSGPFGSAFNPRNSAQVFVSDAHGGANAGAVSAYIVANNATLTAVPGSPFADGQTAPCWLVISSDGKYLYTLNTASRNLSTYAIGVDGTLTLLVPNPATLHGAQTATDIAIDPSARGIFALEGAAPAVAAYTITNGLPTEIGTSPFPLPSAPSHPSGIAATAITTPPGCVPSFVRRC